MNILISGFFCFEWQFSVMNILILLLLLFHFYFYFHFIIKMFCFVLFCVENKQKRIYCQFNGKENNFAFFFYFNFNSKQLKFNLKLTNLCGFDEWQLSATLQMITNNLLSFRDPVA